MDSIAIDTSELRTLAADMRGVDHRVSRWVAPIVERGAVNIKNQLQAEMRASKHFKGIASGITYDMRIMGYGGNAVYEAEIGPEKGRPGSLANVAYYGTSRGGGTVPIPDGALHAELPRFADAVEEFAAGAVFG